MPVMSRLLRPFQAKPTEPEAPDEPVILTVDQVTDLLLRQARHENPGDPDVRQAVQDAVEEIEHNATSRLADDEEKDAWWLLQRGRTARAVNVLHRNLRTGLPEFMRAAAATRLGALTMLTDRATAICYFERAWTIDPGGIHGWLHWMRLMLLEGHADYSFQFAEWLAGPDVADPGGWFGRPFDGRYANMTERLSEEPIREQGRIPHVLAIVSEGLIQFATAGEMHPEDHARFPALLENGQALARETGDRQSEFRLLAVQVRFELLANGGADIDALINQAIETGRAFTDPADRARVLELLAVLESRRGNADQANDILTDAVDLYRQCGDCAGEAFALRRSAEINGAERRWQDAAVALDQALDLFTRIGFHAEIGRTQMLLGDLADEMGDRPGAIHRWLDALVPLVRGGLPGLAGTIADWLENDDEEIRVDGKFPWLEGHNWDLPVVPQSDDIPGLARKYLAEARSLARRRAFLQSTRRALQAVIYQPEDTRCIRFFARSLEALGFWDAARKAYDMRPDADGDYQTMYGRFNLQISQLYLREGNYLLASVYMPHVSELEDLTEDLALAQTSDFCARLKYLSGDADAEKFFLDLAIQVRSAIGQNSLCGDLYFRKGLNELHRNGIEGLVVARSSFRRAAELFTADADLVPRAEAHLYLGDVMMRLDEPEDAFQAWAEALDCYRRSRLPAEALLAEERLIQAGMV